LESNNNFGSNIIISDERNELLETGGGLKKASGHLSGSESIVLYNVDIISNIDLDKMKLFHENNSALATLATRKRTSSRYLLFDDQQQLCGWTNTKTSEVKMSRESTVVQQYAFSGIQIISPEFLKLIELEGKFSIISTYLNLAKNHKILSYQHDDDYWFDIGNPDKLNAAKHFFNKNELDF
jgi:N-acetyl-alpha-D-muramate 1-phosphate uridylyltransferase